MKFMWQENFCIFFGEFATYALSAQENLHRGKQSAKNNLGQMKNVALTLIDIFISESLTILTALYFKT